MWARGSTPRRPPRRADPAERAGDGRAEGPARGPEAEEDPALAAELARLRTRLEELGARPGTTPPGPAPEALGWGTRWDRAEPPEATGRSATPDGGEPAVPGHTGGGPDAGPPEGPGRHDRGRHHADGDGFDRHGPGDPDSGDAGTRDPDTGDPGTGHSDRDRPDGAPRRHRAVRDRGGRRGAEPEDDEAGPPVRRSRPGGRRAPAPIDPDADPEAAARAICLRLLTGQARTRAQLAEALRARGVPDEAARTVLGRFAEVGLIDDAAFAEAWVESRHGSRGLSRRALARELRDRGVAPGLVDQALDQVDAEQEAGTARALVARRLPATRGLDRHVRMRRLAGMLARKGYGEGLALRVIREALDAEAAEGA